MGTFDLFGDFPSPLTRDQRAIAILDDIGAALPCDGGDNLDEFTDELIDEGCDLKEVIRVLMTDAIEAQRLLKNRAARYAYEKAGES